MHLLDLTLTAMASSYLRTLCAYSWTFSFRDSLSSAARRSSSWTAWFSWRVTMEIQINFLFRKQIVVYRTSWWEVTKNTEISLIAGCYRHKTSFAPRLLPCFYHLIYHTASNRKLGRVLKQGYNETCVQNIHTCVMVLRSSLSCELFWERVWFSLFIASNSPLAPSSCC